ncbi:hypothetical protein G6F57_018104 [Rhizopus arrhizus]|nr:hypothetical protein G6F57_018104 [Rhizopus arrhizus]
MVLADDALDQQIAERTHGADFILDHATQRHAGPGRDYFGHHGAVDLQRHHWGFALQLTQFGLQPRQLGMLRRELGLGLAALGSRLGHGNIAFVVVIGRLGIARCSLALLHLLAQYGDAAGQVTFAAQALFVAGQHGLRFGLLCMQFGQAFAVLVAATGRLALKCGNLRLQPVQMLASVFDDRRSGALPQRDLRTRGALLRSPPHPARGC